MQSAGSDALPKVLGHFVSPLMPWLARTDVIEVCMNRPGEVFVEVAGKPSMERHVVPSMNAVSIRMLAQQIARETNQVVNEHHPLLSAAMPGGERFQAVLPPAAPSGGAISIRKHVTARLSLGDWGARGGLDDVHVASSRDELDDVDIELCEMLDRREIDGFFRLAVLERRTMIVSGGTSSGKTTFASTLLSEVPGDERLILLQDVPELDPPHLNVASLLASKGDQGRALVTIQSLLEASLRMRPDRLFLGELRGAEAFAFLRAVNTGHPGSITTVHADSTRGALEQLAMMTIQGGVEISKSDLLDYIGTVVPIVVQMRRKDHPRGRGVQEVYFDKFSRWEKRA